MDRNNNIDALSQLALRHGTDKWGSHFYTQHYNKFFEQIRDEKLKILEIGVGGYKHLNLGAQSLRMWKDYFINSEIYALDIEDKTHFCEDRITILKGDQTDEKFLRSLNENHGPFDIIIDDGSHMNNHIIKTFKVLFPLLNQNGIYAVEDLQTSYWKAFGGNSFNFRNSNTAMNFFKSATDSLNYQEFDNPHYNSNYLDKNVRSISFFHNLVIINKGKNNEGSNIVSNNRISKDTLKSKIKYSIINLLYRLIGTRNF